ncbi:AraC family transcriptional regulator of adaptative response / DNA-3-methyladenine glycosylase II [Agromyces sp. 3263]|uniref:DNA-3-methyladenine glycosylase 2 family protein n=1 Tax=Agromyces sp. 3263 TaxID=2817750 RepID=UPI00285AB595|nr:AlkA N-terminal domain-containing protein [Agromyces sp. 3263]MDR6904430.1 AraC family transcriptional regulator of adaptative response / DNA-3-methyladenine glycosylase II [Agromyces sp. 3263]
MTPHPATIPSPARTVGRAADPLADPVFAERYRAMQARDARFDGQFITGVHSTGIYCRPSCPAVAPKPSNVSFYLTAAAAHEAGLRACKRCLPDAVPGSPEWDLRDDLAARAMRLIADGIVEREGVPGLAARLGYTPRHLTRVLTAELGAGPLALSRAHRAQTARALLNSTALPVADVAFAAGFGSIRQFNDTIRAVYERSPLELRAAARLRDRATVAAVDADDDAVAGDAHAGVVHLRLPARAPFDVAGVFAWLGARALDGVEEAGPLRYRRTLRLPGGAALVRLEAAGDAGSPAIDVHARLATLADLPPLVARVRRLFDLDADAVAIDAALSADPRLAASVAAVPGIRVPGCLDPHELVFRALIGQQVSVKAARTALARLAAELGDRIGGGGSGGQAGDGPTLLFPTAGAIAAQGERVLRGPAARIRTIVDVARRLDAGDLVVAPERERDELARDLLSVPGIGPWTAGYVAMRVTRAPDVLLTGDLALRNGAVALGLPRDASRLAAEGARWAPWRSYASMHLWRAA